MDQQLVALRPPLPIIRLPGIDGFDFPTAGIGDLGRVLDYLEEAGQLDNTLLVFSSDNGPLTTEAEMPWEIGMAGETNGLRGKKRYLVEHLD